MKRNRIYFYQELLITQINNLIFFPLAMTIVTLFRDLVAPIRPSMLLWMLCGVIPLLLYLIRCRLTKFVPFIGAHVGVMVFIFGFTKFAVNIPLEIFQTFQSPVNRALFVIMAFFFTSFSIYMKMKGEVDDNIFSMPVAVGVAAVSLYLQHYQGNKNWDSYYIITVIIILALYFIYRYLAEYLNFLVVNSSSTGVLPEKEIFSSGLRLAVLYTLAGAIILVCTSRITWLKAILGVFRNILRVIVQVIALLFLDYVPQTTTITQTTQEEQVSEELLAVTSEPAMIWKILEVVAVIALFAGLLFAFVKLMVKLIAFIKKAMLRNVRTHDETISEVQDVREKCTPIRKKKAKKQTTDFLHFLDAKERIRRIYKKKVLAYKPLSLDDTRKRQRRTFDPEKPQLYTAREMQLEMGADAFAEIYEKARYSDCDCIGQDVKRMKELCR